ncbi:hypothetical protein K438DRAFT_1936394 [Mycena galopus ATCC 62051]|nr:hypothetical protein K438DRAFT_1936394 [Mycena galopus ATCC 62051]
MPFDRISPKDRVIDQIPVVQMMESRTKEIESLGETSPKIQANNFLSWQVADQWQCCSPPSHLSTPFPAVVGLGVLVAMLITLAADRARVADLDAEILHLERSLSALRSQRQLVLERLDCYKYPVLTLPNEITAEIFTHFLPLYPICPPLTGLYSPTLFTQICRQWREIALETPILWRAISLSDSTIPFNAHISVWLERSRYCPLSLHFDDDDPISGELLAAEVLAAIVPHRARWDHLTISLRLPTLLHAIEGPMPLLRRLNLSSDGESDAIFSLGEAPLLRSVTLNVMTPLNVMLPFAQLTSLALEFIFRSEYVVILPQTFNLVHCKLGIVSDGEGDRAPDKGIELRCLESLALFMSADGPVLDSLDDSSYLASGISDSRSHSLD